MKLTTFQASRAPWSSSIRSENASRRGTQAAQYPIASTISVSQTRRARPVGSKIPFAGSVSPSAPTSNFCPLAFRFFVDSA
eukprot:7300310-Prymnesium_polylepis.1